MPDQFEQSSDDVNKSQSINQKQISNDFNASVSFENFSTEDRDLISNIKKGMNSLISEFKKTGISNSQNIAKDIEQKKELPSQEAQIENQIENSLSKKLTMGARKAVKGLNEANKASSDKKLSSKQLKEYYKSAYKKIKQDSKLIEAALKGDKELSADERKNLGALAKSLNKVMTKINDEFVKNQQRIEKELENIKRIEEHEEKKKKKSLGKEVINQLDQAFDALASILLPPEWYLKAKEKEASIEGTEIKPKQKEISTENNSQQVQNEVRSETQSIYEDNAVQLGNLSAPKVPNLNFGRIQESIPADFYRKK